MTTTKKAPRRRRPVTKSAARTRRNIGHEIIAGLTEAIAFERGERTGAVVRSVRALQIAPAPDYGKGTIAAIRADLGFSQALFAQALNVSPETVKAWEQGKAPPSGAAKRLLEIARAFPAVFLEALHAKDAAGV